MASSDYPVQEYRTALRLTISRRKLAPHRNDTSYFIPLGLSLEYQVGPTIAFSSTLMVNLHHITLSPPVPDDDTSVALLFGMRWGP